MKLRHDYNREMIEWEREGEGERERERERERLSIDKASSSC